MTLESEYEKEHRSLAAGSENDRSRVYFKEGWDMEAQGFVYHPKFMEFDLDLGLGPQQQKEKAEFITGESKFRNSHVTHYHLRSHFLKAKPVNFGLSLDNYREVLNRDFFERQVIKNDSQGIDLRHNHPIIPWDVSFENTKRDIDRSFRTSKKTSDKTLELRSRPRAPFFDDSHVEYIRNEFEREDIGLSTQEGESDQVALLNNKYWGDEDEHNFFSHLNYRSLEGTRASEDFIANESLTISHTDDLKTMYRYNFADRSVEAIDEQTQSLGFGLRHQLYESLVTSFNAAGDKTDSSNLDERSRTVSIDEDYRKAVGPAVLRLGAGNSYKRQKRESSGSFVNVINESHTLVDGTVVLLNEVNIDLASITVTDSGGTTIFIEDVDYRIVSLSGGQVEIRRITTGSIANGDEVLVDYNFRLDPSLRFDSMTNSYRFGLGFWEESLRFYYRLRTQDFLSVEGRRNTILEKFDDAIVGSDWQMEKISLNVEYEDYRSNLTPFHSLQFTETINEKISPRGLVLISAQQGVIDLVNDERTNYEIRGDYILRLSPSAVLQWEAGYRIQKGRDTDLADLSSKLLYRIHMGLAIFETQYEYLQESSLGDDLKNHFFSTKFIREF